MNWTTKSNEIADIIIESIERDPFGMYARSEVLDGLRKAVMAGLKYECDCWVKKTRK